MVSLREMARADAERAPPPWLQVLLLLTTFFEECPEHQGTATGSSSSSARSPAACNFFCTTCAVGRALCAGCVAAGHRLHQVIQIRKSSNHSVVRVSDLARLLDVSMVQTYIVNGERVVFLNPRPVTGHGKPSAGRCQTCERGIQDVNCRFCSLGCKVEGMDDDFDVTFAVAGEADSETSSEEGAGATGEPPAAAAGAE
ncbi:hypothetical protein ACP4OV_009374 [Aristida adscensionis]